MGIMDLISLSIYSVSWFETLIGSKLFSEILTLIVVSKVFISFPEDPSKFQMDSGIVIVPFTWLAIPFCAAGTVIDTTKVLPFKSVAELTA